MVTYRTVRTAKVPKRPMPIPKNKLRFCIILALKQCFPKSTDPAIACSARADAAAPSGGMAVVTAAWGMSAGVMVQVRVRT
jgi:hypothetical protein